MRRAHRFHDRLYRGVYDLDRCKVYVHVPELCRDLLNTARSRAHPTRHRTMAVHVYPSAGQDRERGLVTRSYVKEYLLHLRAYDNHVTRTKLGLVRALYPVRHYASGRGYVDDIRGRRSISLLTVMLERVFPIRINSNRPASGLYSNDRCRVRYHCRVRHSSLLPEAAFLHHQSSNREREARVGTVVVDYPAHEPLIPADMPDSTREQRI